MQTTMYTIWRFSLYVDNSTQCSMPRGARLIHAEANQQNAAEVFVWAIVDPTADYVPHRFAIRGTGAPVDEVLKSSGMYFRTVHSGPLQWHIFDCGEG